VKTASGFGMRWGIVQAAWLGTGEQVAA